MLKLLDRYLLKRFLINLAIAVIAWVILFLVIDLIENVSRFMDQRATVHQVFMYYLYYIPYIISLTLPVDMLLAALFSMNGLAQHNEVVAELSAGVSLYRLLRPLFVLAFVISIAAGFFNELIVPESNQRRWDIRRYDIEHLTRPDQKSRSNIYVKDSPQRTFNIKYFNGRTNTARSVSIKTFKGSELIERIDADRMIWKNNHWILKNGHVRRFTSNKEILSSFKDSVLTHTRIEPQELSVVQKKPEEMSLNELNHFITRLQSIGADTRKWIVERHLKLSLPFANLIVVLLGAPFASRKRRGGAGLSFGLSLLISFIYFIIIRVGQVLGHQGELPPLLAAWLGNLIFLTLGLYSLFTVQK